MKAKKAAVLSTILLLSGCSAKPSDDTIRLGLTVYDNRDVFLSELTEVLAEDCASPEKRVQLIFPSSGRSQHMQNSQVEDMAEDGCDVLLVNLEDRTAPGKIIDIGREYDIPIIFFNREPVAEDLHSWDQLYYVGANAEESAIMQGNIVVRYLSEHPEADRNGDGVIQYYVLEGEPGHQDSIIRSEKSVETIKEAGITLEKTGYGIANWNRMQAYSKITEVIRSSAEIELLLCNNDDMACGAIDAYEEADISMDERPLIIGVDGTKEGLQMVMDGKMIGTVYNDSINQAHSIYKLAIALATGESTKNLGLQRSRYIMIPYAEVTAENAEYFYELN